MTEQVLSPQVFFTQKVVEMAREIDNQWKTDHLSVSYIRQYAQEKNLWLVAVLNAEGEVIFASRSFSDEPSRGKTSGVKGDDLLTRLGRLKNVGFIALQRPDGSGTIVIALDQDSAHYWGTRVSVEKAIEKLGKGQGQGLVYLTVRDKKGLPLGNTGKAPEELIREKSSGREISSVEYRKSKAGRSSTTGGVFLRSSPLCVWTIRSPESSASVWIGEIPIRSSMRTDGTSLFSLP